MTLLLIRSATGKRRSFILPIHVLSDTGLSGRCTMGVPVDNSCPRDQIRREAQRAEAAQGPSCAPRSQQGESTVLEPWAPLVDLESFVCRSRRHCRPNNLRDRSGRCSDFRGHGNCESERRTPVPSRFEEVAEVHEAEGPFLLSFTRQAPPGQ